MDYMKFKLAFNTDWLKVAKMMYNFEGPLAGNVAKYNLNDTGKDPLSLNIQK